MRAPDLHNRWSAWRLPVKPTTKPHASLGLWVVHCPGVHVAWSYWAVSLVHLRPLEGAPPAALSYPDAEYEITSIALDPAHEPDVDGNAGLRFLMPVDVSEQFHGCTDAQAVQLLDLFIRTIVDGRLAPDSDFRSQWKRSLWATLEHITTGHVEGSA